MYRPLADVIRPVDFSDVVGQAHILGKNTVLRRSLEGGNLSNMIFYGPSGVVSMQRPLRSAISKPSAQKSAD